MKLISILAMLSFCLSVFSAPQESIIYRGQESDRFDLDMIKKVTLYRTEYRDSTCTRRIPYTEQECGYETRYRQECHWQSGRNECRTEYDTQCRTITRYRRECRREPGRRVCRNTQPRQICRNGRCRTEPSRRICDTKPGREVCRQVPYTDRECTREPRRVCNRIPGRNICDQVPYQEYICRDVTRYRSETYACKEPVQIPYQVEKNVRSQVSINYNDQTKGATAELSFILLEDGQVKVDAKDRSEENTLISVDRSFDFTNDDGNIESKAQFDIGFLPKEKVLAPIKKPITSGGLTKNSAWFSIGKVTRPESIKVKIEITRTTIFGNVRTPFNRILTAGDFQLQNINSGTKVYVDLSRFGIELDDKKWRMNVEVSLEFESDIINMTRTPLKRSQSFEIRVD